MTSIVNIHTHSYFAGKYTLQRKKAVSGLIVQEVGPFDNLITLQGLDQIGKPPIFNTSSGIPFINTHCGVGTGTTAPSTTDTVLESPLAMYPSTAGSNVESCTTSYVAASSPDPAYYRAIWAYTFPAGSATGNLSEVGVGGTISGSTTPIIFSRALIVDGGGVPTTITVLSDEILVVTYELRLYIDQTDSSYSFFINTTSYSGTLRRALLATPPSNMNIAMVATLGIPGQSIYTGAIGPVTGSPSGIVVNVSASQPATYTNGTYYNDFRATYAVGVGTGNITAIMNSGVHGSWQFSISPAIPKTSSISLQLNWRQSWSLYP